MRNRIMALILIFIALFSFAGYSQTTETSKHPLLDKYYPRNEADTNKAVTTEIRPFEPQAVPSTTTPVSTTTNVTITPTTPAVNNSSMANNTPVDTASVTVNKPATATIQAPPAQPAQPKPPAPPLYRDTRLGSSTKQYDTWEKNNNGAGSVTTSPK